MRSNNLYRAKDVITNEWVYGNLVDHVVGCVPLIVVGAYMQDDGDVDITYHFVDGDTVEKLYPKN